MSDVRTPLQALQNIITRPNGVFKAIDNASNWSWLPFILLSAASVASIYLYFEKVDFNWYVDSLVLQTMSEISPAEQDQFRNSMSKEAASAGAGILVILSPIIVNALLALYFNSVTKRDESHTNGFTEWYGFTWWIQLPSVLNAFIACLIIVFASSNQLPPTVLSPLSLAFLFSAQIGSDWFNYLSSVRLDYIWMAYLTVVGLSQWTSFDSRKALTIAVVPFVAIYSVWALFIIF